MICVELYEEIPEDPDEEDELGRPIVGYFQNFGITATSEREACEMVEDLVADGEIVWRDSRISTNVIHRVDQLIIEKSGDWTEQGVWYRSGRVFFPAG